MSSEKVETTIDAKREREAQAKISTSSSERRRYYRHDVNFLKHECAGEEQMVPLTAPLGRGTFAKLRCTFETFEQHRQAMHAIISGEECQVHGVTTCCCFRRESKMWSQKLGDGTKYRTFDYRPLAVRIWFEDGVELR
jgi:hypothetical protein